MHLTQSYIVIFAWRKLHVVSVRLGTRGLGDKNGTTIQFIACPVSGLDPATPEHTPDTLKT